MDSIESIALPLAVPPAALRQVASAASDPIEGMDADAIRRASDEEKKQLAKDFESVLLTKLFEEVKTTLQDQGKEWHSLER